jgi:hypothetical protein
MASLMGFTLRSRRLRRIAVAAAFGGLLLNAATPLLASAAATIRGVSIGEICDVYGFRASEPTTTQHAAGAPHHHHAMPVSADADDAAASAMHGGASEVASMDGDPAIEVVAPAEPHSHSPAHHGVGDHCALTALATFAPPALPPVPPVAPTTAHAIGRTFASDDVIFDAVTSWALRLKRGPPPLA